MKQKNNFEVIKHFLVYGLGIVIINAAGFLLIPIYTHYLPASEFGILEIINRCVEISNLIFTAGLGITSLSFYASEKEQAQKNNVISTANIALFASSIVGATLFLLSSSTLNNFFFSDQKNLLLFRMASITMAAEMLSVVPSAYIRASMRSQLFIIMSAGRFLSIITLNIVLIVFLNMRITGVILGNMLGSSLFALILLTYSINKTGLTFNPKIFKRMLSFGLPFIPGGFFLFILNNGDRFFIQSYYDSTVLGIYALGYKLGTLALIFILGPFLNVWGPYMFKLDQSTNGSKDFNKYFIYLTIAYCMMALTLSIFSKEILMLISDEKYWDAYQVIPLILVAYLFWAAASFFDSGFYITKKTLYKPFIMGAAMAFTLVMYSAFIPFNGLLGGALATAIGFLFFSALTYLISNRIYPVQYQLKHFAFVLGLGAAIYLSSSMLPNMNLPLLLAVKVVMVITYPVIILLTGIVDKRDIHSGISYVTALKNKIMNKDTVIIT